MSTVARFTRNEMVAVMDSDYVHLAESKGLYGGPLVGESGSGKSVTYDKNASGIDYEQDTEHHVGGPHTVLATGPELAQWTRESSAA